jgi:pimeloyl-ACP methyl ester carboxylesterase
MRIELGGHSLAVDVSGDGEALLLVHGLGGTSNFWAPVTAAFAPRMRVIAPDLPGAGRSAAVAGMSFDSLAGDLLSLLDALGVTRARVAGHSMGSIVCQHLAARAPARVRDLVLLGPLAELPDAARPVLEARAATAREQGMAPIAEAVCERGLSATTKSARPVAVGFVREMMLRQDPAGYAAHCLALAAARRADPAAVTCRTLLVCGTDDTTAPPASVEALAASLAAAEVVMLPDCGHWTAVEKPDEVVAAMRAFYGA